MMPLRLARTIRHLRTDQMLSQIQRRMACLSEVPDRGATRVRPPWPGCRWPHEIRLLPPGMQDNTAATLAAGRITLLNDTRQVGWPPDWTPPGVSKLWAYHLHYFDCLWDLEYAAARSVVLDWMNRHPKARSHVGWEPYPTSLRLINWCAVFFGRFRPELEIDRDFRDRLWESLARQAAWLEARLEFHLRGNHLLENAAALLFTGSCFEGPLAAAWRSRGAALLRSQLAEQILADGGQFERSPMYQARTVYVLAMLLAVATGDNAETRRAVASALARAERALGLLCHPDGGIALFNDSALDAANDPATLRAFARATLASTTGASDHESPREDEGAWALPDTGYYGIRTGGTYLVCDAGPIGPDYLPGHGHGDLFSFELSLDGERTIVDTGVHDYEIGALRAYCRSTRAHNTIEIDGQDQCEFWAAFRVARRGRPRDVIWEPLPDGQGFRLRGWHDGYERLCGRPRHHRSFVSHQRGDWFVLMVKDRVWGRSPQRAVSRLHLAPGIEVEQLSPTAVGIRRGRATARIVFAGDGHLALEPSIYCPEFGRRLENQVLTFSADGVTDWTTGFAIVTGEGDCTLDLQHGLVAGRDRLAW